MFFDMFSRFIGWLHYRIWVLNGTPYCKDPREWGENRVRVKAKQLAYKCGYAYKDHNFLQEFRLHTMSLMMSVSAFPLWLLAVIRMKIVVFWHDAFYNAALDLLTEEELRYFAGIESPDGELFISASQFRKITLANF